MMRIIDHFTPILFTPATTPHMSCTDVFADTWMTLVISPAIGDDGVYKPIETLERIKGIDWAHHGLCAACVAEKDEEWAEEQERVWTLVDKWMEEESITWDLRPSALVSFCSGSIKYKFLPIDTFTPEILLKITLHFIIPTIGGSHSKWLAWPSPAPHQFLRVQTHLHAERLCGNGRRIKTRLITCCLPCVRLCPLDFSSQKFDLCTNRAAVSTLLVPTCWPIEPTALWHHLPFF